MTFKLVRELRGEIREGKRTSGCYFGRGVEEAGDWRGRQVALRFQSDGDGDGRVVF
jgi:hypothetical protein